MKILKGIVGGDRSDKELLKKYQATKDKKYITDLYGRYVDLIYGVCLRYNPHTREAEDQVMSIYELVVEKALHHKVDHPRGWLYVVAKNYCLGELRKLSGIQIQEFDPKFMQYVHHSHPMEEMEVLQEKESTINQLELCLEQLNSMQRRSINLFYFKNLSYAEIADKMQLELSQVRSFLQNGRRNLRNCIKKNTPLG